MSHGITIHVHNPPLPRRIRNRCQRIWTEFRLNRRKARYRLDQAPLGTINKTIGLIAGCQRSGTTITLRALNRSLDVDHFNEIDPRAFHDCRIKDKATLERLRTESSARCLLFKPVCDSHRIADLLAELPDSKAIWMYREYQDVANSAVQRWGDTTQRHVADLLQGGGDWGVKHWNRERVTDECLAEIREAAGKDLSPHAAAALFWYMRNRTFFEQRLETHPALRLTRYERLVRDPEAEFRRLCGFLNIRFEPEIARDVKGTSVRKQPFPPVNPQIHALCEAMLERLDAVRAQQA